MSEDNEYDLKKIRRQLYPVLKDKRTGKIIDGLHRLEADPSWKTEEVDTRDEGEFLVLRLQANKFRRTVPESEISTWMNELADYLSAQGVAVGDIANRIAEDTGYSPQRVRYYLSPDYKAKTAPLKETLAASVSPDKETPQLRERSDEELSERLASLTLEMAQRATHTVPRPQHIISGEWDALRYLGGTRMLSLTRLHSLPHIERLDDLFSGPDGIIDCESTVWIPFWGTGWICPNKVQWVVVAPYGKRPLCDRDGWLFLCEKCVRAFLPRVKFHDEPFTITLRNAYGEFMGIAEAGED